MEGGSLCDPTSMGDYCHILIILGKMEKDEGEVSWDFFNIEDPLKKFDIRFSFLRSTFTSNSLPINYISLKYPFFLKSEIFGNPGKVNPASIQRKVCAVVSLHKNC